MLVGGAKMGLLKYVGRTDFAKGIWAGIELDEAIGKNDGAVAGKRYMNIVYVAKFFRDNDLVCLQRAVGPQCSISHVLRIFVLLKFCLILDSESFSSTIHASRLLHVLYTLAAFHLP